MYLNFMNIVSSNVFELYGHVFIKYTHNNYKKIVIAYIA